MNMNYSPQSQFELFPGSGPETKEARRSFFTFKDFYVSPENIIISSIVLLMTLILCFSFGVEHGKKVQQTAPVDPQISSSGGEKINVAQSTSNGIMPPSVEETLEKNSQKSVLSATVNGNLATKEKQPKQGADSNKQKLEAPVLKETLPSGAYTIQVASFKLEKYARQEAGRLNKIGYQIFVVPKGTYSLVCVGKFSNKDEAQKVSNKLRSKFTDRLVRRL